MLFPALLLVGRIVLMGTMPLLSFRVDWRVIEW